MKKLFFKPPITAAVIISVTIAGIFTGNRGQILDFWQADIDRSIFAPDLNS